MTEPIRTRLAARAVLIDSDGRTLLFRAKAPGPIERTFWITPGGGIDEGEAEPACVRREVYEETGLTDAEVGPCVWKRDYTFRWGEGMLRQVESYYLVRSPVFEVNTDNHEELERTFLVEHRWFTLAELHEHDETLVPANLAELVAELLAGNVPAEPIVVGA